MAVYNIHALQNSEDLAYLTNKDYDYYVHALANIGQRSSFSNKNAIRYSKITFDENDENMIISEKSDILLELNNDLSFDITINNVEAYKRHSLISDDNEHFKRLSFCKILGTDDIDEYNIEIQYDDVLISNGVHDIMNECYRAFHLADNIFIIMHIKMISNNIADINYRLDVHSLSIDDSFSNIKDMFNASTYDVNSEILFNDEKLNISNAPEKFFNYLIDNCSTYSETTVNENYVLNLTYDKIENQYIAISSGERLTKNYENIHDLLYFDVMGIDRRIQSINTDVTQTYPQLLKYYSYHVFNGSSSILKKSILQAIYNKLYDDVVGDTSVMKNGADPNNVSNPVLKVSNGFTITYISNVEDSLKIYYTNDIFIDFVVNDADVRSSDALSFIYKNNDVKTSVYIVSMNYNDKYDDLINNIEVIKKYTLPFVNDSGNWQINDVPTNNSALGEAGGTPNLIFLKTKFKNESEYEVELLNRVDLINGFSENIQFEMINGRNYMFILPNFYNKDNFKYATCIITSNVYAPDKNIQYYKQCPNVTTLWSVDDSTQELKFKCFSTDIADTLSLEEFAIKALKNYDSQRNKVNELMTTSLCNNLLIHENETIYNSDEGKRYFTIGHKIDNIDDTTYEGVVNYNVVEMKIDNNIEYSDINDIQVVRTFYDNRKKYIELYNEFNDDTLNKVIAPYTYMDANYGTEYYDGGNLTPRVMMMKSSSVVYNGGTQSIIGQSGIDNLSGNYDIIDNSEFNSAVQHKNEFIPRSYIPTLDTSEMIISNQTDLNRIGIMSVDHNGDLYYGYIGSSSDEAAKNKLHIGTSKNNINIGTKTLCKKGYEFNMHDSLALDFSYVDINANAVNTEHIKYDGDTHSIDVTNIEIKTIPIEFISALEEYDGSGTRWEHNQNNFSNDTRPVNNAEFNKLKMVDFYRYVAKTYGVEITDVFNNNSRDILLGDAIHLYNNDNGLLSILLLKHPFTVHVINKKLYI